ncbi:transmembrane protein 213-like [Erpetoichthys calabaricus]|uniref:transmembrane protein 213-like n=1 Tax=Erpetoichthys calabaricus TaxID=27687 RepID=UPI00109F0BE5|nr:transmembrane protein 213-like [Erpetoichthys calabaricus]
MGAFWWSSFAVPVLLLPLLLLHALVVPAGGSSLTSGTSSSYSDPCLDPNMLQTCSIAAQCCQTAVDDYGWIAAAVGWSLWFLTMILFCVSKLLTLGTASSSKYTKA